MLLSLYSIIDISNLVFNNISTYNCRYFTLQKLLNNQSIRTEQFHYPFCTGSHYYYSERSTPYSMSSAGTIESGVLLLCMPRVAGLVCGHTMAGGCTARGFGGSGGGGARGSPSLCCRRMRWVSRRLSRKSGNTTLFLLKWSFGLVPKVALK